MNGDIAHRVEQLLGELGEYTPLDLLLQEGRLTYADYEAWRHGEIAVLEAALFGAPAQVHALLDEAGRYLVRRGWLPEPLSYQRWPDGSDGEVQPVAQRNLRFSADREFDACFLRGYRRNTDEPQLDLFSDSAATALVNGIVTALAERAVDGARRQLERLYEVAPDHPRVGELDRLTSAAERLDSAVADVADEVANLRDVLGPLADEVLGRASHNLLVPLWRRLGDALNGRPFDPAAPELHASFTAVQSQDWSACVRAVEGEPDWQNQPTLAVRHAHSSDRQRDRGAALASWFGLCWRFPEHLESSVETSSSQELRQLWTEFADADPPLATIDFPAWTLIRRPGLVHVIPERVLRDAQCPDAFRTLVRLRRADGAAAGIELRATLQDQAPQLLRELLRGIARR